MTPAYVVIVDHTAEGGLMEAFGPYPSYDDARDVFAILNEKGYGEPTMATLGRLTPLMATMLARGDT